MAGRKVKQYTGVDFLGAYVILAGLLLLNLGRFFIDWTAILWFVVTVSLIGSGIGLFFRNQYSRLVVMTFLGIVGIVGVGYFLGLGLYGIVYEALAFLGVVAPTSVDASGYGIWDGAMWVLIYAGFLSALTLLPTYYLCLPYVRSQFNKQVSHNKNIRRKTCG